jgi:hypothetical protein
VIDERGSDPSGPQLRMSILDLLAATAEGWGSALTGTALTLGATAPPTAVQEREVEPGAVPKASLSQVNRIRNDRSAWRIGPGNCCAVHESTACWKEENPVARGRSNRSNRRADDSEPRVRMGDFNRNWSFTWMPKSLTSWRTVDTFE